MTEIEKLQRAKMYIDKLANGVDPINDVPVADTEIINNVRISRCLFYVSDILKQVIDNNGVVANSKSSKRPFFFPIEKADQFPISPTPIPISEIVKRFNELVEAENCCKLSTTAITDWLVEIDALKIITTDKGSNVKRPTENGSKLGILTDMRTGMYGEYTVVLYDKEAQQFILDNIDGILDHANTKKKAERENQGLAWTPEHEKYLIDMFNKNTPISEIALSLKRTRGSIRARLKKMGLID